MNLVQNSVEDLVTVTLTRASWSRRMCFLEEDGEVVVGKCGNSCEAKKAGSNIDSKKDVLTTTS